MLTGASGFALAKVRRGPLVDIKMKRMSVIAANGVLILIPCAIVLDCWAAAGDFDMPFFIVQGIELAAGAVNLALMGLNMRDGFGLTGQIPERRQTSVSFPSRPPVERKLPRPSPPRADDCELAVFWLADDILTPGCTGQ